MQTQAILLNAHATLEYVVMSIYSNKTIRYLLGIINAWLT